jgi:hypothetical protein
MPQLDGRMFRVTPARTARAARRLAKPSYSEESMGKRETMVSRATETDRREGKDGGWCPVRRSGPPPLAYTE